MAALAAWALAALAALAPPSELRWIDAVPQRGAAVITLRAGDRAIAEAPAAEPPRASDYVTLPDGPLSLMRQPLGEQPAWTGAVAPPGPGRWSLVLLQPLGERTTALVRDDPPALEAGQCALRLLHAVADVDRLRPELWRPAGPQWRRVAWPEPLTRGTASTWYVGPPGPATLKLFVGRESDSLLEVPGVRLLDGWAVTVVALGLKDAQSDEDLAVQVLAVPDATAPETAR